MNRKVLLTIGNLEYPFSEGTRIGPEAVELVRGRIETSSELGNPRLRPGLSQCASSQLFTLVLTANFSVVDPQRMMCTYGPA
jgi:hypothetical protein